MCGANRYLLANCEAEIQIIEVSNSVSALGKGCIIVDRYASHWITYNHRDVREVNFVKVDHMGFARKALRQDGRYETFAFSEC